MSSDDADAIAARQASTGSGSPYGGQISDATEAPGDGHEGDVEPLGGIVTPPAARSTDGFTADGAAEARAHAGLPGDDDAEPDVDVGPYDADDDGLRPVGAAGSGASDDAGGPAEGPEDADEQWSPTVAASTGSTGGIDPGDDEPAATLEHQGVAERNYYERSERSIWGTDDEDDGYSYVRRSDPNWDLSKWLIVGAIAAVFVLLSFLMIPRLFTPAQQEAGPPTAKTTAPATSAPAAVDAKSYRDLVLGSGPTHYWQFSYGGDPSADAIGTSNLTLGKDVSVLGSTAIKGQSGAIDCTATTRSIVNSQTPETPTGDYTLEAWVNTTSPDGGQILSFGNKATGSSSKVDRTLYIDTAGLVYVGTRTGSKRYFAGSETIVTDGKWHHVVGTMSTSSGLTLYVDGVQVATEAAGTSATEFEGFWRICGDSLSGWPRAAKTALTGSVDDVAVYSKALSADEVKAHFTAAS